MDAITCGIFPVLFARNFQVNVAAFLTAIPQLGEGEHFTSSQQHAATGAIVMQRSPPSSS